MHPITAAVDSRFSFSFASRSSKEGCAPRSYVRRRRPGAPRAQPSPSFPPSPPRPTLGCHGDNTPVHPSPPTTSYLPYLLPFHLDPCALLINTETLEHLLPCSPCCRALQCPALDTTNTLWKAPGSDTSALPSPLQVVLCSSIPSASPLGNSLYLLCSSYYCCLVPSPSSKSPPFPWAEPFSHPARGSMVGCLPIYFHFHPSPAAAAAAGESSPDCVRLSVVEASSDEGSTLPGRSQETRPGSVVRQGLSMPTWSASECSRLAELAPDSGAVPLWSPLACRVGCDSGLPVVQTHHDTA